MFDIKILGSDQYVNTQGLFDFDGSDSSLVSFEPEKNYSDVQTAEIQFLSNGEGLTTSWMQWIAGLYYFEGISGFDPIIGIVDSLTFLDEILSQIPDLGVGIPTGDIYIEGVVATESEAAFLQTTFNVFEWLDLTLGLRYQVEKRNIVKGRMGLRDTNGDVTILQDYGYATTQEGVQVSPSDKTSSLSPKVSIDLRPFDEDTLIYLSYQEATKSATFNATVVTAPPTYAAPETLTAWELGIKTKLFDRMTLSAAMFKYDIDDLQVQFLALLNGGVVSFENARSAKIRGMDFDMTLEPSPDYLPGLTLTGGAGWLKDAEYNSYPNGAGFQGNSGQFSRNNDFTGNRIVRSAEYTASFSLSQTVDIVGGPLEMSVDYYYNDGFFYEASNNPRSQQDRYETYGARVSYLLEDQNLRLTLFGKNLKDKVFSTGNVPNDFGSLPTINPEATFGLRINWQFFGGES